MKKEEFDGEKIMDYYFKESIKHMVAYYLVFEHLVIDNHYIETKNGPIICKIILNNKNVILYANVTNITNDDQFTISSYTAEFKNYYTLFISEI